MRACTFIAALALASLNADAQQASPERAAALARAQAHIAKIAGPSRSITVAIDVGSGSPRTQIVQIKGPISDSAIVELVHLQLEANRRYVVDTREWEVEVVGDTKFARLTAALQCPAECSYLMIGTYSFEKGKWLLINGERVVA